MVSFDVLKVNTRFIRWKALYFFVAAAQGPVVYFLVNFYISRGISYEAAGFIESIVPFLGCIFRPLACYLADRFALHRALLASSTFIYSLALLGFLILSTRFELIVPAVNATSYALTNGNFSVVSNVNATQSFMVSSTGNDFIFPLLCGLRFLSTLGLPPATSLLDGIVYHSLEASGQSENWGRQRLWGSIGFSSSALLSAFLLDMFTNINYVIGFSLALGGSFALFVLSLICVKSYETSTSKKAAADETGCDENLVPNPESNVPVKEAKPKKKISYFGLVMRFVFRDSHVLLVMTVAGVCGFFTAGRDVFVSPFLEDITHTSTKLLVGVMQAIIGSLEIPVMFTAGWFFEKIGTMPFFAACFGSFALRFWFYTLLTADTVWFFLLIELLHVFCFGFVVPAFTLHAHRRVVKHKNVLPEISTIMQGFVSTLYLGFGYGIGCIAGGVLMQRYQGQTCMMIFSIIGAASFVIFCIVWLIMFLSGRKKGKGKADQALNTVSDTSPEKSTVAC